MERDMGFSSKHETVDFEIQTETYVPPSPPPCRGNTLIFKGGKKMFCGCQH